MKFSKEQVICSLFTGVVVIIILLSSGYIHFVEIGNVLATVSGIYTFVNYLYSLFK